MLGAHTYGCYDALMRSSETLAHTSQPLFLAGAFALERGDRNTRLHAPCIAKVPAINDRETVQECFKKFLYYLEHPDARPEVRKAGIYFKVELHEENGKGITLQSMLG